MVKEFSLPTIELILRGNVFTIAFNFTGIH